MKFQKRRMCRHVSALLVLVTAVQAGAFSIAAKDAFTPEDLKNELSKYNNPVTQYTYPETNELRTTIWTKGIRPPEMEQFRREVTPSAGNPMYIGYVSPYYPNQGWYDVNKTEDRENDLNLCFAAAASNSLHWWMDRNQSRIDRFVKVFAQSDRIALVQKYDHSFRAQNDSEIYKTFSAQYAKRKNGNWPDVLQDQFINGYHPKQDQGNGGTDTGTYDSDAERDKLLKNGPYRERGLFYDIFRTDRITERRLYDRGYDTISADLREMLQKDSIILLTYDMGAKSHVVTLWGAEYDLNGMLSAVYITDSDDDSADGMQRYNVYKDSSGRAVLTNRTDKKGSIIVGLNILTLGEDLWSNGFGDTKWPVKAVWDTKTKFTYNGTPQMPSAKVENVRYGDDVQIVVSGAQTNGGTHQATAELTGKDADRYTVATNRTHTFTIGRTLSDLELAAPTVSEGGVVTLRAAASGYDLVDQTIKPEGNVRFFNVTNGAKVEIGSVSLKDGTAVFEWTPAAGGRYDIQAVYEGNENFEGSSSPSVTVQVGAVLPKDFKIDPISAKTYGDPSFTVSATGGYDNGSVTFQSKNPDVISISGNMATIHRAGEAVLTAVQSDESGKHTLTASVSVTVQKKELDITADDTADVVQGSPMPEFTYRVDGLVNGDRILTHPVFKPAVQDTNAVGSYEIGVSGGTVEHGDSYEITYHPGTMTVVAKEDGGQGEIVPPPAPQTNPFVDVSGEDYFYDAVQWAVARGITSGVSQNRFGPGEVCTRGQAVMMLWRYYGSPEESSPHGFGDVNEGHYYHKAVQWAKAKGITSGVEPNVFGANDLCTRAQIMTMLWRAAGSPQSGGNVSFDDVKPDDYFAEAVRWAEANGVTAGIGNGMFGSYQTCNRAHMVTFLYKIK